MTAGVSLLYPVKEKREGKVNELKKESIHVKKEIVHTLKRQRLSYKENVQVYAHAGAEAN